MELELTSTTRLPFSLKTAIIAPPLGVVPEGREAATTFVGKPDGITVVLHAPSISRDLEMLQAIMYANERFGKQNGTRILQVGAMGGKNQFLTGKPIGRSWRRPARGMYT
jgi:hypothetical protein